MRPVVSLGQWRELVFFSGIQSSLCEKKKKILSSLCRINGVPACAHKELLGKILREEWGFQGYVVSDANAVFYIREKHGYTDNDTAAVAAAVSAGVNLELATRGHRRYTLQVGYLESHRHIHPTTQHHTHTLSLALSLSLIHTHTHTHSLYVSLSPTLSLSLSHTHTHTHTHTQSLLRHKELLVSLFFFLGWLCAMFVDFQFSQVDICLVNNSRFYVLQICRAK